MLTYLRKIEVLEVYTKTDPSRRAVRLLGCLDVNAFEKTELIKPAGLRRPDGVEVLVDILRRHERTRLLQKESAGSEGYSRAVAEAQSSHAALGLRWPGPLDG